MRLTDDDVLSVCVREVDAASGGASGELSSERAEALDRYLGKPYGDEVEGRSQVRTREVLDTIQWIVPSLVRIFVDQENLVVFDPVGPEDEDAAAQETDRVAHAFWKQNRGFYNIYTFVTDALLSKTGVLKTWWEDEQSEREEYRGLSDLELAQLVEDDSFEREILEFALEDGGYHIVFRTTRKAGRVRIEPCPPEEFGVCRSARSPYAKDARFCYHRTLMTRSDLIEMGYERDLVDSIPFDDGIETAEQLSRRNLSDEQDRGGGEHDSLRELWITECYVRLDRDDDGIAELLKVTMAAGASSSTAGATLLEVEDVDRVPFSTAPPIILTHKFDGLSLADLVVDLQEIKTTLVRGVLDNMYLANNQRTAVNDLVNLDDALTFRPGGIVRTDGEGPPAQSIFPIPTQPVPTETFGLLEYLDEMRKQRTGVGDEVAGLDKTSLGNVNTGVFALAFDAARMKIELIARILAEIGLRPCLHDVHELLQKKQSKAEVIKLRGRWVEVNPAEWKTRENMTVQVGVGVTSRERRMMGLDAIMEKQGVVIQGGGLGTLLTAKQIYKTLHDYTETWGLEPSLYWQDPEQAQPPEPKPDYNMLALQLQDKAITAQREKTMLDSQKLLVEQDMKAREMGMREQEAQTKRETQRLSAEIDRLKLRAEATEGAAKRQLEVEVERREQQRADLEVRLEAKQSEAERQIEIWKALLQSGTTLTKEQMALAGVAEGGAEGLFSALTQEVRAETAQAAAALGEQVSGIAGALGEVTARIQEMREAADTPRSIERDESGRIVAVGGKRVARDAQGLMTSIG